MVLAALLAIVGVVAIMIASGLVTHRRAASAADLAALSAATTSTTDRSRACEAASRSADLNDAELVSCVLLDRSVTVVVRITSELPWLPGIEVAARAG